MNRSCDQILANTTLSTEQYRCVCGSNSLNRGEHFLHLRAARYDVRMGIFLSQGLTQRPVLFAQIADVQFFVDYDPHFAQRERLEYVIAGSGFHALRALGIQPGDRVSILSENRPEWSTADFACLLLGAVTVPLYTTLTPEQTAYALNDAGCRVIFVSSDQQLHKVLSVLDKTRVEKVFVMDALEFSGDLAPHKNLCMNMRRILMQGPDELGPELEARARSIEPDDLATIVYTSGTTGNSKGAMLTHGNIASNIQCSLLGFDVHPGLTSVSFLPLCHITARHVDFAMVRYCPQSFLRTRQSGNRRKALHRVPLIKDPALGRNAQFFKAFLASCFAVNADNRLCSRQAIADPGPIVEQKLQTVCSNNLADRVSAKIARIGLQLFSELRFDLRGQSEVLPLRKE